MTAAGGAVAAIAGAGETGAPALAHAPGAVGCVAGAEPGVAAAAKLLAAGAGDEGAGDAGDAGADDEGANDEGADDAADSRGAAPLEYRWAS